MSFLLRSSFLLTWLLSVNLAGPIQAAEPRTNQPGLRFVGASPTPGPVRAVIVPDGPLIHTAQFLPIREGQLVGSNVSEQWGFVWEQILDVAKTLKAEPVRVHVYGASQDAIDQARAKMDFKPFNLALTFVVGELAHPQALIAADAVLATSASTKAVSLLEPRADLRCARASVMPGGAKLYVSGQAEKGDLATATRNTLESLERTLKTHGRAKSDTVQVKAFLTPMSKAAVVREEIEQFFGKDHVPPVVLVEWTSSPSQPIEIELVAWGGPARAGEPVEYLGAPSLSDSPIFSRVARVNHGPVIYFGEISAKGEATVESIFNTLEERLQETGSDFRHLVKATYYVSDNEASTELNKIRPTLYDPKRPPAASKAPVQGTGLPRQSLALEMIAVPASVNK